jgi:hypothetical protein
VRRDGIDDRPAEQITLRLGCVAPGGLGQRNGRVCLAPVLPCDVAEHEDHDGIVGEDGSQACEGSPKQGRVPDRRPPALRPRGIEAHD